MKLFSVLTSCVIYSYVAITSATPAFFHSASGNVKEAASLQRSSSQQQHVLGNGVYSSKSLLLVKQLQELTDFTKNATKACRDVAVIEDDDDEFKVSSSVSPNFPFNCWISLVETTRDSNQTEKYDPGCHCS